MLPFPIQNGDKKAKFKKMVVFLLFSSIWYTFQFSHILIYFFRDTQTKEQRQTRIVSIVENEKKRKSKETSEEMHSRLGIQTKKAKTFR